jgi:hypothetical protein
MTIRRLPVSDIVTIVVGALVLIAVAWYQSDRSARSQPRVDSVSSLDRASGGYAAWYELLSREGVRVSQFQERPAFLDRTVDTLIVADSGLGNERGAMDDRDRDALARWVRTGGHVIVLGDGPLIGALAKRLDLPTVDEAHAATTEPFVDPSFARLGVARLSPATNDRLVAVNDRTRTLFDDKYGSIVLEYPFGKGDVIAIDDETMFANNRIASFDHARAAYALVAGRRSVAFDEAIHGYLAPEHWWQVVPRPFLIGIAITLAALALALVGSLVRLGPPTSVPSAPPPTSAAFLSSLAMLLQRNRARTAALADAFASAKKAVAFSLGIPDDSAPRAFIERIPAEWRATFVELVDLTKRPSLTNAQFVRGVELARSLRKDYGARFRS